MCHSPVTAIPSDTTEPKIWPQPGLLTLSAVQRIAQCGGLLSTSQMALFQLVGDAKAPTFKTISAMAKEMRADPLPIVSNL